LVLSETSPQAKRLRAAATPEPVYDAVLLIDLTSIPPFTAIGSAERNLSSF
jgi:hypothetical protein